MSEAKRGKIILIEGPDFSGKKTQAKLLVEKLRQENIDCVEMSFPRYDTPTGRIAGGPYLGKTDICPSYFKNPAEVPPRVASLYFAADREYARARMEQIISNGINIILDRYVESNMAHQGAKEKSFAESLEIVHFIESLEYTLLKLPKPSKVIFLSLPLETILKLKEKRDKNGVTDGHETKEHLERAVATYDFLANSRKWDRVNCINEDTKEIRSPEDISREVYAIARETLFSY